MLFDKIALQAIAGEKLVITSFFIITGDEHFVEGGPTRSRKFKSAGNTLNAWCEGSLVDTLAVYG